MAKLNQSQKDEAKAIAEELATASTWLTGPKSHKLVTLAERVSALADVEPPVEATVEPPTE